MTKHKKKLLVLVALYNDLYKEIDPDIDREFSINKHIQLLNLAKRIRIIKQIIKNKSDV